MAIILKMDLTVFGEGSTTGVNGSADAGQSAQASAQTAEAQPATARDYDAEFEQMVNGEYKDQFDRRVASIIQKRLKNTKDAVDKFNRTQAMRETLARKYGVSDAEDVDAIAKAVEEDSSYLEEEALERGISVEQMREIRRMERENKQLTTELNKRKTEEQAREQQKVWLEQEKEAKKLYPSISLAKEIANEQFRSLLLAGVDVKTAYSVVHQDEIIPQVMRVTAEQTAARTANAVRANGMRPVENGSNAQAASTTKYDVSKMTRQEREKLMARAKRGEKITL